MLDTDRSNKLVDTIYEATEPHSMYVSRGSTDENLYFAPPEIIEILAWILAGVALPIFTGVVTTLISDRIKNKTEEKRLIAMELQKQELEELKREVSHLLEKIKQEALISEQSVIVAKANLSDVLKLNGWPSDVAESDAEHILTEIRKRLSSD